MTLKMKKYPILLTTLISCVIIVASLFILGFFGLRTSIALGGGTQVEVVMKNGIEVKEYSSKVSEVLKKYDMKVDSNFVEDKYVAGEEETNFSRKCLVIQIAEKADEETLENIKKDVATSLNVSEDNVSVGLIEGSIQSKSILRFSISLILIVATFFIFGWFRYDVFAGISFVIAFIHNIILYFALIILMRVQLTVVSISTLTILSLLMSTVLICIYEKFREVSRQKDAGKILAQQRMIPCELEVIRPFAVIFVAILVFALCMFALPVSRVAIISLNMIIALLVSSYTALLIGPSSYVALLEIKEMSDKAVLSRNDTINKEIKKKIKRNTKNS